MEHLEKSTNEWFRLGDVFYRRYKLSSMEEQKYNISYSFCHFAVAKNGGLMGIYLLKYLNIKSQITI